MPSGRTPTRRDFKIEESGRSGGRCACCGSKSMRVWGSVRRNGEQTGAYFVTWTVGRPDHGALFTLVLGKWGESGSESDRFSVSLHFHRVNDVSEFMIIDAQSDGPAQALAGRALKRSEVIGTPLATQAFVIADAVYMSEGVKELRSWSEA